MHINYPVSDQVINMVYEDIGIAPYVNVDDPFNGVETIAFPFPQLFRSAIETYLFFQTSVKDVDESVDPWTASARTTFDISDGTTPKVITGNGRWHFADLGGSFYAFNGTSVVFKTGLDSLHGVADRLFCQNTVKINSGCYHKGRCVIGGFNAANFWGSDWSTLFTSWLGDKPTGSDPDQSDISGSYIFWSSVGAGDFPLWLFYPDFYGYDLSNDSTLVMEAMKKNQFGYMRMPFQGDVLAVLPLGERLAVYGEQGVAILKPYTNEFASGYGLESFSRVGIAGRDVIAGHESLHIFLDDLGRLWRVTEKGVGPIGYEEYFQPMLASDIAISVDPYNQRFYISGSSNYVYSNNKLSEITQKVISVDYVDGEFKGMVVDSVETDKDYIYLTTGVFDFGYRGMNTITSVQIDLDSSFDAWVALDYRYDKKTSFVTGIWKPINRDGYAYIRIAALEFRVRIKVDGKADTYIRSLRIKYQNADKRYSRGPAEDPTLRMGDVDQNRT